MGHVFISYSREDRELASEIERRLEAMGVRVWIDKQIPTAARWEAEITQAIDAAAAFLTVWTASAAASEWVNKEIDYALKRTAAGQGLEIVSYKKDGQALREDLRHFQHNATADLVAYLREWRSKPLSRKFHPLEAGRAFKEQARATSAGDALTQLPFGQSVHCKADLFAEPGWQVRLPVPDQTLAVFLATTRGADEAGDIELIRIAWNARCPGKDLVLLRVTGPSRDGRLHMNDSGPNGEWLDLVETLHSGIQQLVGTGSATLLFFTKTLTPLALLAGWRLERYWHVELHHYTQGPPAAYRHVASSCELARYP